MIYISMVFDGWDQIERVFLSVAIAYPIVIIVLRLAGKRSLSKLNAFDFIVTIALGSVLASTVTGKSLSVSEGLGAFAALAALQLIVSWISNRSHLFAKALRSEPRILLRDGKILHEALKAERITQDEVEAAIRKKGHGRVEEITAVVLESDGAMSVIEEGCADDCTALRSVLGPKESSL
jgi:uncharacterized membrane protein YcaP (DUF421 family)